MALSNMNLNDLVKMVYTFGYRTEDTKTGVTRYCMSLLLEHYGDLGIHNFKRLEDNLNRIIQEDHASFSVTNAQHVFHTWNFQNIPIPECIAEYPKSSFSIAIPTKEWDEIYGKKAQDKLNIIVRRQYNLPDSQFLGYRMVREATLILSLGC